MLIIIMSGPNLDDNVDDSCAYERRPNHLIRGERVRHLLRTLLVPSVFRENETAYDHWYHLGAVNITSIANLISVATAIGGIIDKNPKMILTSLGVYLGVGTIDYLGQVVFGLPHY